MASVIVCAPGRRRTRCAARQSVGTTSKPAPGRSMTPDVPRRGGEREERLEHRDLPGEVEVVDPLVEARLRHRPAVRANGPAQWTTAAGAAHAAPERLRIGERERAPLAAEGAGDLDELLGVAAGEDRGEAALDRAARDELAGVAVGAVDEERTGHAGTLPGRGTAAGSGGARGTSRGLRGRPGRLGSGHGTRVDRARRRRARGPRRDRPRRRRALPRRATARRGGVLPARAACSSRARRSGSSATACSGSSTRRTPS